MRVFALRPYDPWAQHVHQPLSFRKDGAHRRTSARRRIVLLTPPAEREAVVSRTLLGALIGLVTASWVTAEEPLLERQYLTGSWNGVRPALSAYGFEPYFIYT